MQVHRPAEIQHGFSAKNNEKRNGCQINSIFFWISNGKTTLIHPVLKIMVKENPGHFEPEFHEN